MKMKFHNTHLRSEFPSTLDTAKQVNRNGFSVELCQGQVEDTFACPYYIEIEGMTYWYSKKETRNLEFKNILQIFATNKINTRIKN